MMFLILLLFFCETSSQIFQKNLDIIIITPSEAFYLVKSFARAKVAAGAFRVGFLWWLQGIIQKPIGIGFLGDEIHEISSGKHGKT